MYRFQTLIKSSARGRSHCKKKKMLSFSTVPYKMDGGKKKLSLI
jgi:hypothetical protein